ncbi:MAG: ectonucleotide pyrophosphatase/phosphodiesterase, partial [Gemmatimonadota bacterium]
AVLLVSIDGFRADYLDPLVTPNLMALANRGVRAEALIPSFPTKTFPNHYTMVTGLRPDHHGLVANNIWDPDLQSRYSLGNREAVQNADWYGGVPVWVAAERAGLATAPMFWPGSEAAIQGVRPRHWLPYDDDMPHDARIDWVLDRLAGGVGEPVRFATLYFSDVDAAGHDFGPGTPEVAAAVARIDLVVGRLLQSLIRRELESVNVIVVSDHGMSRLSPERMVFLDDYLDPDSVIVVDWSPVLAIWPGSMDATAIYDALRDAHPNLGVYRPAEIPLELEFGTHHRVAPVIGIADPGWSIASRDFFAANEHRFRGGNHGYDQRSVDMRALFLAAGPAFRAGLATSAFPNVDVYELIMAILRLPAEPGDGDLSRVEHILR